MDFTTPAIENPITIDGTITSRIIFIITLIIIFVVVYAFGTFEIKLMGRQAKEVDRYMAGPVSTHLLHSPNDYKQASLQKSTYLLFKRTWMPFTFLVISAIIFLSYIGGVFHFRLDNELSIEAIQSSSENICHWGSASLFNLEPLIIDTGWGFSFMAGIKASMPFSWVSFYVVYTNITTFIACLLIFIQLQGFVVRHIYTNHVAETSWNYQSGGNAK